MSLDATALKAAHSGGIGLHGSFLHAGLQSPQLKRVWEETNAGQLCSPDTSWLPTRELPCAAWLSPSELLAPFRPYSVIEEQMKWFNGKFPDTDVPRDLLRSHLSEVLNPDVMDQQSSCLGNRVAAVQVGRQSLVFSCCGSAGQMVTLNVLKHQAGNVQCEQQLQIDTSKPIQQVTVSSRADPLGENDSSTEAQVMVAARGPHQIAIMRAVHHNNSRWDLQLVAIVRSKAGVSHVTWNPFLPCQAAFSCEDGSLHILVVTNQPTDVPQMSVQVHTAVQAGNPLTAANKLACEWTHPAKLTCTAGRNLMQCQLAGLGREARVVLLHSRQESDEFVALARPGQGPGAVHSKYLAASTKQHVLLFDTRHFNSPVLCWAHKMDLEPPQLLSFALSGPVQGHSGQDQTRQNELGATGRPSWQGNSPWSSQAGASSQHMASQAGANYPLGSALGSTGLRGFRGSSQAWLDTQGSQAPEPFAAAGNSEQGQGQLAGAIVASSLALGHCKAFRFLVKTSGQCLTAQPPEEGAILKKRSAESSSYRRRENWGLIQAQAVGQDAAGSFAWKPGIADAVQSSNLPRTVCQPLKTLSNLNKGAAMLDLAAEHGTDWEQLLTQCPDLKGMTIIPMMSQMPLSASTAAAVGKGEKEEEGSQHRQPDTLLVRVSFVGDMFLQPCFLFTPLPNAHAATVRQQQAKPQQILTTADLAKRAQSQHNRQGRGQQQRANGSAEGQNLGHVTGLHSQPDELPSFSKGELVKGQLRKAKGTLKGTSHGPERQQATAQTTLMGKFPQAQVDAPQQPPSDSEAKAGSMLNHIDMRQSIKSRTEIRKRQHADPRWKTDKSEVKFDHKGLFKADVSVHHALLTASLQSYCSAYLGKSSPDSQDRLNSSAGTAAAHKFDPNLAAQMSGNVWGFADMDERLTAAGRLQTSYDEAEDAVAPTRLPFLQAATTVDELQAQDRWAAPDAEGQLAPFEAAVPVPKFRPPNKAAAVARALPIVTAAYRALRSNAEAASSSASHPAANILSFAGSAGIAALATACRDASIRGNGDVVISEGRSIPLAAWKGVSLGPEARSTKASSSGLAQPDSQASVHLTQPSQGMPAGQSRTSIPLVQADRVVGGGQLACPVTAAHTWSGDPVLPPSQQPMLHLKSYYAEVGDSQEQDDIQELEDLWLAAHGQQRSNQAAQSSQGLTAGQRTPAAGSNVAQAGRQRQQQPTPASLTRSAAVGSQPSQNRAIASTSGAGLNNQSAAKASRHASDRNPSTETNQLKSPKANESKQPQKRKSVQFAATNQPERSLLDVIAEKWKRDKEQQQLLEQPTQTPASQAAADTVPPSKSQLTGKSSAKRTKPSASFVEGF